MTKRTTGLALTLACVLALVPQVLGPTLVLAQDADEEMKSLSWTVSNANTYLNDVLQNDMLVWCAPNTAFLGYGTTDSGPFPDDTIWAFPNFVAIAALTTRSTLSDNPAAYNLAMVNSWSEVKTYLRDVGSATKVVGYVENGDQLDKPVKYSYLQFAAMEFLSTAYQQSQNGEMATALNTLYNELLYYQANSSLGYYGDSRAFWTAVVGKTSEEIGIKTDQTDPDYDDPKHLYPLANSSLWAAAGLPHAYLALKGTGNEIPAHAVEVAEAAMAFVDSKCWNGLFYFEYPGGDNGRYYLQTQALAMLAYARLYQATHKAPYLTRARALLHNINQYMWVSGLGGATMYYDVATSAYERSTNQAVLQGYGNALLAYAAIELHRAAGYSGSSEFLDTAESIMNFLWNWMRFATADEAVNGFVEYIQNTPGKQAYAFQSGYEDRRYTTTNALGLYVNEQIAWFNRSLWEKYMWYFVGGIGAAVVATIVVILVRRRSRVGTKLPKVVKGLIGD
ncbi:MAG: hypothetical protein Kow0069_06580 [Promethearchaeota archaeon]